MEQLQTHADLGVGPPAVRAGRSRARELLAGRVNGDDVDAVVLVVSELVTNATLHVGGPVRLDLSVRPGIVRVDVHDVGTRVPSPRRALDRERTSGRGLHLVDRLSQRWGTQLEPGGKVVWCEIGVRDLDLSR